VTTLAGRAEGSHNASTMIREQGRIDIDHIYPQKGRHLFRLKEIVLNALGGECGEEIEVVAIK
jgi:hypothetical protein